MWRKKDPADLLVRVSIQLPVHQIRFLDQHFGSRSEGVRAAIRMLQEGNGDHDLETTFDAYAHYLFEPLEAAAYNGGDLSHIIPSFSGFMRKTVGKTAPEDVIEAFLRGKMLEISKTND